MKSLRAFTEPIKKISPVNDPGGFVNILNIEKIQKINWGKLNG